MTTSISDLTPFLEFQTCVLAYRSAFEIRHQWPHRSRISVWDPRSMAASISELIFFEVPNENFKTLWNWNTGVRSEIDDHIDLGSHSLFELPNSFLFFDQRAEILAWIWTRGQDLGLDLERRSRSRTRSWNPRQDLGLDLDRVSRSSPRSWPGSEQEVKI